jgi:16S rRNA (cytosine967-C5)-methyltransferase
VKASANLALALAGAARTVARVSEGRSLGESTLAGPGREAQIDLCFGALRRYGRVQAITDALSHRGRAALRVQALVWCALYALDSGRYADYTVVDQAVRACGLLEQAPARGFVNGVLRNYLREREALERRIAADPEARLQHPQWWIDAVRRDHPSHWEEVLAAGNQRPPLCLRVNRRRAQLDAYLDLLASADMPGRRIGADGILLDAPVPAAKLPGFRAGLVSVQDFGAQQCAPLLDLADGQRVLDACAAPGGKSAHILELADVRLHALDIDPQRAARIAPGLERLGLSATVQVADCTALETWWDGESFDRVLADAPCSGSGVARRHPDIKWLRRAADVPAFAQRQAAILDALWQVLAPGGKLLYVTCSVFRDENAAVLEGFRDRTPLARCSELPGGAASSWLPCAEHDGFYFALLTKGA